MKWLVMCQWQKSVCSKTNKTYREFESLESARTFADKQANIYNEYEYDFSIKIYQLTDY